MFTFCTTYFFVFVCTHFMSFPCTMGVCFHDCVGHALFMYWPHLLHFSHFWIDSLLLCFSTQNTLHVLFFWSAQCLNCITCCLRWLYGSEQTNGRCMWHAKQAFILIRQLPYRQLQLRFGLAKTSGLHSSCGLFPIDSSRQRLKTSRPTWMCVGPDNYSCQMCTGKVCAAWVSATFWVIAVKVCQAVHWVPVRRK